MSNMTPDEIRGALDPVTRVAQDLTEIEDLAVRLEAQVVHKANDRLMPGGLAMVALGPEANLDEWAERLAADELYHLSTCTKPDHKRCEYDWRADDEDDQDHEPPLQTLLFWSEAWRAEHGYPLEGRRPTILSEAGFVRHLVNWAWENEPHFEDFVRDIAGARTRLENVLYAGKRVERGVPCLDSTCEGARVFRLVNDDGTRTDWKCPRCRCVWNEDGYWRMVWQQHSRVQREVIDGVTWCSIEHAAHVVQRPTKTIRTWVNNGDLATLCLRVGRRIGFVRLDEVRDADEAKKRRKRKAA